MADGEAQAPVEQLHAAIAASGFSARRFAREVLVRDIRTLRRWLAGTSPIPKSVLTWLQERNPNA